MKRKDKPISDSKWRQPKMSKDLFTKKATNASASSAEIETSANETIASEKEAGM